MTRFPLCAALATVLAIALPARAQDTADEPAWEVTGKVMAASDYVWRGVSQTSGDPALQLEAYLEHANGFYVGAMGSNVDYGNSQDGINHELNLYIGWAGELGKDTELDVFLSRVAYPGHNGPDYDIDYTEIEATVTFAGRYRLGMAYSPDIFNLGGHGIYMNAGVSLPLGETGFDLTAQVGHYNLNDAAGDSYNDYLLGIGRDFGPLRADLQYTDTSSYGEALSDALDDASQADGRVALMLTWAF